MFDREVREGKQLLSLLDDLGDGLWVRPPRSLWHQLLPPETGSRTVKSGFDLRRGDAG